MTAVAWLGTSIDGGSTDVLPDAQGAIGYWNKGLNLASTGIPRIGLSRGSSQTTDFLSASTGRVSMLRYVDVVLIGAWTNDFAIANSTLASVQTNVLQIIALAKASGRQVYMATMLPRGTSSDSFLTAANQTPSANGYAGGTVGTSANRRNDYNTWLATLADAGTIDGVVDVCLGRYKIGTASYVDVAGGGAEDAGNPGKWITDGVTANYATTEGTHPRSVGITKMANVVSALATALAW